MQPVIALSTIDSHEGASSLATGMVSAKLAACVNIVPGVTSVYEWQGKIEQAAEYLLVIKTTSDRFEELKAWISRHHPYDCPELVAVEITDGLPDYLKWLTGGDHRTTPLRNA